MGSKTRWLALLVLVSALVLLVSTVSAATFSDSGFTLTYPDSREDCSATRDAVAVSGLSGYHKVIFVVFKYESGSLVQVARSNGLTPDDSGNVSYTFVYPAWTESIYMWAQAEVYDTSSGSWVQVGMLRGKWIITCPPLAEACTPGYWKNHYDAWSPTGYSPGDDFDALFGVDYFDPDITLADAVLLGGGGVGKVARFGVASLLSAAHPDVEFGLSVAEVITLVQAGDGDTLGGQFPDGEYVCPLD
jgi:hypothetical protein